MMKLPDKYTELTKEQVALVQWEMRHDLYNILFEEDRDSVGKWIYDRLNSRDEREYGFKVRLRGKRAFVLCAYSNHDGISSIQVLVSR